MQSRTHTCGELRLEHVGLKVQLAGWMENVREVGGSLAFVVVRDFYGKTQLVGEDEALLRQLKGINKESTIGVVGTVRERASKNPNQLTGDVEVVPESITVLGKCRYNELPFEINRSREADETQRLKYRYLDLRNPAVKQNIILRCKVIAAIRQAMLDHDFMEITTPILTASSPEGARDYLVPARKHPGKFYALPQAPQQFKQLLMTSGFDRYFQIAPCFRDEDARGDRSPGCAAESSYDDRIDARHHDDRDARREIRRRSRFMRAVQFAHGLLLFWLHGRRRTFSRAVLGRERRARSDAIFWYDDELHAACRRAFLRARDGISVGSDEALHR